MLFNRLTALPLLMGISSALAEPAPYKIGMMSSNVNPMALLRRQAGYQPTESYCGPGDTCAESCGAGQETCPSSDGLYCYNPSIGDTCCPNLSGHSCDAGYYCTEDSQQETWCCPNGLDLAACQAAYTITGSLVSLTGSVGAPTASSGPTTSSYLPGTSSVKTSAPPAPPTTPTGAPTYGNATVPAVTKTTTSVAAATTSTKAVFTGGASSLFSDSGSQILAAGILGLLAAL